MSLWNSYTLQEIYLLYIYTYIDSPTSFGSGSSSVTARSHTANSKQPNNKTSLSITAFNLSNSLINIVFFFSFLKGKKELQSMTLPESSFKSLSSICLATFWVCDLSITHQQEKKKKSCKKLSFSARNNEIYVTYLPSPSQAIRSLTLLHPMWRKFGLPP